MRSQLLLVVLCAGLLCTSLASNDFDCEVSRACTPINDNCDDLGFCTDDDILPFCRNVWGRFWLEEFGGRPKRSLRRGQSGNLDRMYDGVFGSTYDSGSEGYPGYAGSTYRSFNYRVPNPTYRRAFREGKWHLDNKHMIKNYYKTGTYEMAKKYFIALPFVKIIPATRTTSVDYVGQLQTYDGYNVRLCERCHGGHPQIEFQAADGPSRNVVRRFNFLPDTKRTRTDYGTPRIIQTGKAQISQRNSYGGASVKDGGEGHH